MPTTQKSLRLSDQVVKDITEIARASKRSFSVVANGLLEEAIRTRQCPGIVFSEGVSGKRARIAGTGIEVWEVVAVYLSVDKSMKRLQQAFTWLSTWQLMAAHCYYSAYPDEIDTLITGNENRTSESIQQKYSFLPANRKIRSNIT